ncbi:MAG TPA: T9SS type A sorting domain-containing protein, partial [Bacteroidetes bacterium]|nr:T9SS type A sorting domain-containing protein [Bacteroidota bacterium]
LETTTGNGQFILSPNDTTIIDPPPHDRDYFLAQMAGVAHYFRTVSNGKLQLTGDVYPIRSDGSYQLPHTMEYYHPPDATGEEADALLAELFRDAITAADQVDAPPFDQFDIVVIFHAGVGQDFGDEFDPTPSDIPSAFLNADFLDRHLGDGSGSFPGIATQHGNVREGLILPETQNQQGSEFALKGTFCLLLGNQLGLPSLFNTATGRSGIGAWGLMDAGASNYFGLIPAEPCAWSRVFLGWEEPVLLEPGTSLSVAVRRATTAPHVYRLPVSSTEYFLIENRTRDYDGNGVTTGRDQYGHRLEFSSNGSFTAEIDTAAGERLGVITQVEDYDFGGPGSGILIWHIDEEVIRQNYFEDAVNANPNHRGVDLVEADGSQDIGQSYGFLSPGSGSEYGLPEDAFFADNEVHKLANKSDAVAWGPLTAPSSQSYAGANTGILLTNFSKIDSVMTFDYQNLLLNPHFPKFFSGTSRPVFNPLLIPPAGGSMGAVIQAFRTGNGRGELYAWTADGQGIVPSRPDSVRKWDGSVESFGIALFDTVSGGYTSDPVIGDFDGDGLAGEFAIVADSSRILFYKPAESTDRPGWGKRLKEVPVPAAGLISTENGLFAYRRKHLAKLGPDGQLLWQTGFQSQIVAACVTGTAGTPLAVLLQDGSVALMNTEGNTVASSLPVGDMGQPRAVVSGLLGDAEAPRIVAFFDRGWALFDLSLAPLYGSPYKTGVPAVSLPALGDIDQDGFAEIVFATARDLRAYHLTGVLCSGFPVRFEVPLAESGFHLAAPIIIARNNAPAWIIARDGASNLLMADGRGRITLGNYLNARSPAYTPWLAAAVAPDRNILVAAPSTDGLFRLFQFPAPDVLAQQSWLGARGSGRGEGFLLEKSSAVLAPASELMPYAYNYPNPTRDGRTAFRFFLAEDARISIGIYDLSGEKVDQLSGSGVGSMENEIVWPLGNIASGVYLAHIQAKSASKKSVKVVKVAVVK